MPIGQSAKKSLRQSIRNRSANVSLKSKVKDGSRAFLAAPTFESLKKVYSLLDKAVKNHVFHANKAARLKSRYSKKVVKTDKVAPAEKKTIVKAKTVKTAKKMS